MSDKDSNLRREKRRLLVYHLALGIALLLSTALSMPRICAAIAFLPAIVLSLLAGTGYFPSTTIRQTGWIIVAQTIVFVSLLAVAC